MVIEDKRYEIDEVFRLIGEEYLNREDARNKNSHDMIVDGFHVHPVSMRYMTFYQKGTTCACCGKRGTHFKLCGEPGTNRRHFNLFADDGTLFTKDHILPASKGGKDNVANMQPMCEPCNLAKGNSHPDVKISYIVATKKAEDKRMEFRSLEKAAIHMALIGYNAKKQNAKTVAERAIGAFLGIGNAIQTGSQYGGYIWTEEER